MKIKNKIKLVVFMTALVGCFVNDKSVKIKKIEKAMTKESEQLFAAIKIGNIAAVREILRTCVTAINAKDKGGRTALICASENGQVEIARELLRAGAEVDAKDSIGTTALMYASKNGQLEIVKELLRAGAKANVEDGIGATALMCASEALNKSAEQVEIVRELLKAGAEVNAKISESSYFTAKIKGATVLMCASVAGQVEIVKELLRAGADVNAKDECGTTALNLLSEGRGFGSQKEKTEIAIELLKAGADVDVRGSEKKTALMWAVKGDYHGRRCGFPGIVRELLRAGADVNARDQSGTTALTIANRNGNINIVYLLIEGGAEAEQNFLDEFVKRVAHIIKSTKVGVHKSVPIDILRKYCAYLSKRVSITKNKNKIDKIVQTYSIKERLGELVYDIINNMIIVKEDEAKLDLSLLRILKDYISYLNKRNAAIIIDQKIKGAEETPASIIDYVTLKEILMLTRSDKNEIIRNLIKLKVRWERSGKDIAELKKMEEAAVLSQLCTAM